MQSFVVLLITTALKSDILLTTLLTCSKKCIKSPSELTRMHDVSEFNDENDLKLSPELRMLDLTSEVGELSKTVINAQDYGRTEFERTDELVDEFGDVYYSLLSLAAELDIDAEEALAASLEKYQSRISTDGDAGSGA